MSGPLLIKAGDDRVLLCGVPPKVDCRVVSEELWQEIHNAVDLLEKKIVNLEKNMDYT